MRQRKKFKLFLIIITICAISLFKTIDSIRVPTDWSEVIPTKYPQQKTKLHKQRIVHPKYQYNEPHNIHKAQKQIERYPRIPQRPTYNPIVYKTMPLNNGKQNLYTSKRLHTPYATQISPQSQNGWLPLTTINKMYNLAPILVKSRDSSKNQPYIWVPYQKTQIGAYNTPIPIIQKDNAPIIRHESEPLKETDVDESKHESFESIEPSTRIPNFAEKIYANDPFSREYVEKDGLESRSDNQEEDPENYEVPQDETPISEHETPLDIPTKPIYPGEGEWAKPGRKYRVFNRPEVESTPAKHENTPSDGYEIFEDGQDRFRQAQSKYEDKREKLAEKYTKEDDDDNESEPLYEKPQIGFVPLKTYAQVRKSEITRHLPQSEAYKEATSEEELVNAPRLREVIKNTRAHTVYTEEGYEDEAYDHGGKEKKAEENDGFLNLEDDFEDYKEKRKKGKKSKYNDQGHKVEGVDNESRLTHEDTEDKNEDHGRSEEYENVEGDSSSSGSEFKKSKHKPRRKNHKGKLNKGWSKSEIMKDIKETTVTDMIDGQINLEVKKKIEMVQNPDTRRAKKYEQIQSEKSTQFVPSDKKDLRSEIPSTTTISNTKLLEYTNKNNNLANAQIGADLDIVSTTDPLSVVVSNTNPKLQKKIVKKVKISEINTPTGSPLTRVKRYDREKLSKIYIRKRPKYYWERSKNRGNMKIEFNQTVEKPYVNRNNNTKGIHEPIPVIKPISKLAYKNRPKRDLTTKGFQIDYPRLNIDELGYDIVDVSKIAVPTPKPDLTFIKYPYYLMAESGRINKHSPLKYAEDLRKIPEKSEGGMEFYESSSDIQCPEVETTVEPIPDRIKNKEQNDDTNENNDDDDITKKIQTVNQIQRLRGLGDKIDCLKVKYFGENPLDSPFFKEDSIEAPSMDSVFPLKYKKHIFKKQPIKANLNFEETKEQISYIQQIAKSTEAPKSLNTHELVNNMKVIVDYLSDNIKNSSKKLRKRDTVSVNTDHSFQLDTIVVLDEESTPDSDSDTKKLVIVTKSENQSPEFITEELIEQKTHEPVNEDETSKTSTLILTTTLPSPTTTEVITTTKTVIAKRRRRPFVSTVPPEEEHYHYSEQQPEDFVLIIDTGGENLSDIPLQLPLVNNNKEFGKTFDISKYLPNSNLKPPKQIYNFETKTFESKTPNSVEMEVFADILQHMKTATSSPQTTAQPIDLKSSVSDVTIDKPSIEEDVQKSEPVKRKIRKPNRKMRMRITNSSLPPPGQETIFSKPEPIYNDQPTSETETYSVYNDQPTSGTENHSVRDALEVDDLNRPNLKSKYPGTYKTLYLQDNDEVNRDIFTPDHYEGMPEYSSDPDHPEAQYNYPPSISDEFKEIGNPNIEPYSSKYSVHEINNGNSIQYDLVFNRIHNSYLLRPVKHNYDNHNQYSFGYHPVPNYTPEFKPIIDNQVEEILIKGLKPVQYQNGLKLVIPQSKMPKQVVEQFQTFSIRPIQKLKPFKVIRLAVNPKKVVRITTKQPLRVITPQHVPIPIPISQPHRFSYHQHNTHHADYYNIHGMVPPLISEHNIGYSNYQPITFARPNVPYDSLADENAIYRKSFEDLQMESSGRMETVVDINGKPITSPQRIYTELDQYNRQANQYKKIDGMELMKGEVLLSSKDSHSSSSINRETDVNLAGQKTGNENLKDSYGNIVDKPLLSAYSSVVVEMAKEAKKYVNESHEPNMSIENKTETGEKTLQDNIQITTVDSRRGEPKYENKIQNTRIRVPTAGRAELPITNRRRYKNTTSGSVQNSDTVIIHNTPQVFDINQYIPDSKLMRELRRNNTLFMRRKSSNSKPEAAESQSRHSYSSRFNSADEQLPLPTEKTLQKPVVLVIEQIVKPNNDSKSPTLRKNRYQKQRKIEDNVNNNPETITTTTQRIVSFRRVRPIPIVRTSSSIVTSDITESTIRKSNRPRNSQFLKSSTKLTDPIVDQKEHIINRSVVNKTIRTNINSTPRQKLVVDPVALRQKARAEAQAEAMERVKEKLELNTDKNSENQDAQDKLSNVEEESKPQVENPSNNRHYEKNEHRHTTSEVIHTKIYSPEDDNSEGDYENDSDDNDDNDEEDNEHGETLNKDYSEQVEIIGDLEQIRNGPKHGGNYRHINDQKFDDTNHDDRRDGQIKFEETEDESDDEDYEREFSESKIKPKGEKPENNTEVDDYTSSFYSDPNLPKKINNLKHDDTSLTEDHSVISPSKVVKLNKEQSKPSAYWSKIIKDPSMRQYFYVRE